MALRSTYDTGEYGSGLYGEPETTQFAATVSFGVSASASAVTVVRAAATAAISSSATASGEIIKDGAVTANLQGIVNVSAITYEVVAGFRAGYGLNTYGSYIYGENYSVEEGSATANISVTPTVSYQVVRQVSATPAITVTPSAQGFMSIVGAVSDTVSITPNIEYNRIRLFSASDNILGDTVVSARYKWLPATDPTTTWTTSDYLERAA
jgi:hypothetical protein